MGRVIPLEKPAPHKENYTMWFALCELYHTLRAAWEAADVKRRLREWWYVVTHRELLDD